MEHVVHFNPFVPTVAFSQPSSNLCCPRDCVSWHNGGTSGAPLKPLRDDSALRIISQYLAKAPQTNSPSHSVGWGKWREITGQQDQGMGYILGVGNNIPLNKVVRKLKFILEKL